MFLTMTNKTARFFFWNNYMYISLIAGNSFQQQTLAKQESMDKEKIFCQSMNQIKAFGMLCKHTNYSTIKEIGWNADDNCPCWTEIIP